MLAPLVAAACSPTTTAAPVASPAAPPPPAVAPPAPAPGPAAPAPPVASDSPAVAAVQGQLDAYNAHDLERFLSFYAPDVVAYDQGTGDALARGIGAMRDLYGKLFVKAPTLRARLVARTAVGRWVVDHESLTVAGDPRTDEAIAIYEVIDGRIRRVWFLASAPPAAKR